MKVLVLGTWVPGAGAGAGAKKNLIKIGFFVKIPVCSARITQLFGYQSKALI